MENWEKVFGFSDNTIWVCCGKFSLLLREYLPSDVRVLTNSLNISDLTKSKFFQLNLSKINRAVVQKWWLADFGSVWEPLTRWLRKGCLKKDFLNIKVAFFFGDNTFQNTQAMKLMFSFKIIRIWCRLQKPNEKSCKSFWLWDDNIWYCCGKSSLLWGEYLSSALKVLTNSPNI